MRYIIAARSIIGRVRKQNEDNYCIDGETLAMNHGDSAMVNMVFSDASPHLLGVFDGMGGYRCGERASYLAATTSGKYTDALARGGECSKILTDFCFEANDNVCMAADGSQMGTTCALLCLDKSHYTVCNVGDSPVFLVRDGVIRKLTVDHNQKEMYEKVTGKSAEPNQKFDLTQCIGIPPDEMLIEPFVDQGTLREEDIFLLCSDGITDMLSLNTICETILKAETAEGIVHDLVKKALDAGGKDNATAVCVKVTRSAREKSKKASLGNWIAHFFRN